MSLMDQAKAEHVCFCAGRREQRRLKAQYNREDDIAKNTGTANAVAVPLVPGQAAHNTAWPGDPHICFTQYVHNVSRSDSDGQPPEHIPTSADWAKNYADAKRSQAEKNKAWKVWDKLLIVYKQNAEIYIHQALDDEASYVTQVNELRNASYEELQDLATLHNVDADGVVEYLRKKNDRLRRKSESQREAFHAAYKAKLEDL